MRKIEFADPFEDILPRRVVAYLLDLVFVALITGVLKTILAVLTILSFGLLGFLWWLLGLVALAYSVLLLGGPGSATLGMRLTGTELRRSDGGRPDLAQALIFTVMFYLTIALSGGLVVLIALITPRHRTLHDYLSGTMLVRTNRRLPF